MAYSLPTLDDILPGQFPAGYPTIINKDAAPVAAPAVSSRPLYDTFTPDEKAQADKQADLIMNPRGTLGEIGAGVARGFAYGLPNMAGQILQSTGNPGDTLYDAGTAINNAVQPMNTRFAADENPGAHNAVTNAIASGASMLGPTAAVVGAGLIPGVGEFGAAALGAGAFGAQAFQQTYEDVTKAGGTPEAAHDAAMKAAAITAGTAGIALPGLGKLAGTGVAAIPRVLGKQYTIDTALQGLRNPAFLSQFAKDLAAQSVVQTGAMAGQAAGVAAVEQNAGVKGADPYEAAASSIGPSLAMTGMFGAMGAVHLRNRMETNKQLLNIVENPASNLSDVAKASGTLAPMLEPLVGKDAVNDWRLDALVTKPADREAASATFQQQKQAELSQRVDDVTAAAEQTRQQSRDQLAPPNAPLALPAPSDAIVAGAPVTPVDAGALGDAGHTAPNGSRYLNEDAPVVKSDADIAAEARQAARAAYEQQQRDIPVDRAINKIVGSEPPEGALSFADFTKQKVAVDRKQPGLGLDKTKPTQAGLKLAYVDYLRNFEPASEASVTHSGQDELPLEPKLNAPIVRPDELTPETQPKDAMQVAQAEQARSTDVDRLQREAAGQKAAQLDQLAEQAKVQRNVEGANKLADDAMATRINGNTPVAVSDLKDQWKRAATDAGVDVSVLRGQALGRVQQAISSAGGKRLWASQLNALRSARDKMGKNTVTRDSMDAFINKLENFNGKSTDESTGSQTEEGDGQTPNVERQGQGNAPGDEGTAAVPAEVAPPVNAVAAAEVAPAVKPLAAVAAEPVAAAPVAPAAPEAAKPVRVTSTGKVTEDTAPRAKAGKAAKAAKAAEPVSPEAKHLVPKSEQRNTKEDNKFPFEMTHYDPTKGVEGANHMWLNSLDEAVKLAGAPKKTQESINAQRALAWLKDYMGADVVERMEPPAAHRARADVVINRMRTNAAVVTRAMREQLNRDLERGLQKTQERTPEQRAAELDALGEEADQAASDQEMARRADMAAKFEGLSAKDEARLDALSETLWGQPRSEALRQVNEEDAGLEQAAAPNMVTDKGIIDKLSSGVQNVAGVLDHLATNGPTEWARYMAGVLQSLGLDTTIRLEPQIARSAVDAKGLAHASTAQSQEKIARGKALLNKPVASRTDADRAAIREMRALQQATGGQRVFGRFSHGSNVIRVFLGGENAHTILHETTHAATVGRLAEGQAAAAKPFLARTMREHFQAAMYKDLQKFIAEMKSRDTKNQYGFKNEAEFVAELFSNEDFQNFLGQQTYDGRSGLQKAVDWVRDMLGMHRAEDTSALRQAMSMGFNYLSDSRYAAETGVSFNHSMGGAMSAVDRAMPGIVSKYDDYIQSGEFGAKTWANLPGNVRKVALAVGSTFHIEQWLEKVPHMEGIVTRLKEYQAVDKLKTTIMHEVQDQTIAITKRVELHNSKYTLAKQKEINQKMGELSSLSSIYGVDLSKNFADNLVHDPKLNTSLRDDVNRMHGEFMQLDPELRSAMKDGVLIHRKLYIQQAALITRQRLQAARNNKLGGIVDPLIAKLDIRDPALHTELKNTKDYYPDDYTAALATRLNDVFNAVKDGSELAKDMQEMKGIFAKSVANPYTHLGRYGEHFVRFDIAEGGQAVADVQAAMAKYGKVIGTPDGTRHVFMRFESKGQRDGAYFTIKGMPHAFAENSLTSGSLNNPLDTASMRNLPQFIRQIMQDLSTEHPDVDRQAMNQYITRMVLDYLPESSSASLAPRHSGGVIGSDANFLRNFSARSLQASSGISNGYTMPMFDKAFGGMKDEVERLSGVDPAHADHANAVYGEMNQRFANTLSPVDSPLVDKVKAFGSNFYLAVSPAFWAMNLMQPYQLSLPMLGGRHGFVKAAREMGRSTAKALSVVKQTMAAAASAGNEAGGLKGAAQGLLDMKLVLDKSSLSADEKKFALDLIAGGQLDVTQAREQAQLAEDAPRWMASSAKFMSMGAHYTEVVNRLTAGLASYNLERARGLGHDDATARAVKVVRETQYDYSDRNTGRALGRHGAAGPITPLLTQFQQYSFQTMELLLRLTRDSLYSIPKTATAEEAATMRSDRAAAQKGLLGVMATTTMIAGTLGMPLASVASAIYNAIAGSSDDPSDIQTSYRGWLADIMGKDAAEAVARGIPRAVLGADMSNRAGLQDVLPGSRFLTDRRALKDQINSGALNMMGPAVSAGSDMALGISKISDGQFMDGLVHFLPLALRGPVKAIQMGEHGYTTSAGNKLPMEVTPWAQAVQSLGFTPSVKAEQSDANFQFRQRDQLLKGQKDKLASEFFQKHDNGDDMTAINAQIAAFSSKNPQYRVAPMGGLKSRAEARAVASASPSGIATLPRYLPTLDRYGFANTK